MDTIAQRIIFLRNSKDMSTTDLGKAIDVSTGNIGDWESGRSKPGSKSLLKLCKFFNVNQEWLLEGKGDIYISSQLVNTSENGISTHSKENSKLDPLAEDALKNDPELQEFWAEMIQREDLRVMFKKSKKLPPQTVKQIIAWIKAVEDAESQEE